MSGLINWFVGSLRFMKKGVYEPPGGKSEDEPVDEVSDEDIDNEYYRILNMDLNQQQVRRFDEGPYYDPKFDIENSSVDSPYWVEDTYEDYT